MQAIIGYGIVFAAWLAMLSFGLAFAISPVRSTTNTRGEGSNWENTFGVVGVALGLYVGFWIVLRAAVPGLGVL